MTEAVLISQGDELLTGQTTDSNASWIAGELWALGVKVRRVLTAPDDLAELGKVIHQALSLGDVVICTGGLGPTRDDLTAEACAQACGLQLQHNEAALEQVRACFAKWGRPMADSNRKQAMLPVGATPLENQWGTAPGFVLDHEGTRAWFLPGVPREMRPMMQTHVLPGLVAHQTLTPPIRHIIRVIGLPESVLEERLHGLEHPDLTIGFRAAAPENQVKLLFASHVPTPHREAIVREACDRIGPRAFGVDSGDLAMVIGQQLTKASQTLALAESCTAGKVAAWLGSIPGASNYLLEGAVVYSNDAKVRTCQVSRDMLAAHGAVSEPVARQLAEGIRARAGATWGIGITGIAGPGGGTAVKPVGTVHISVAGPKGTVHRCRQLVGDRDRITTLAAGEALYLLQRTSKT